MTELKDRVFERLEALRLKPQRASLDAGLHKDAVRDILRGKSSAPSHATLAALAAVLKCTPEWLTLGNTAVSDRRPGDDLRVGAARLAVKFEAGAGYWRDSAEPRNLGSGLVQASDEYEGFDQWLERVLGRGFDQEYPEGTLVHVVEPAAISHAPRAGDHVILSIYRDGRAQVERSIREVAFIDGRRRFLARSSDGSMGAPVEIGGDVDGEVSGLILGSYRPRK